MFDKDKNKIVIVHYGNITMCPPVINLIECLLKNGYFVHAISGKIIDLKDSIKTAKTFSYSELGDFRTKNSIISKFRKRRKLWRTMRSEFEKNMGADDIIWTTNEMTVMYLNKLLIPFQERHILQLMELIDYCPIFYKFPIIKFPIDKYARNAWKTVVPEENRAYIQSVKWKQIRLPYVLPNKPYDLNPGDITEDVENAIKQLENEKRKIVLYLGVFSPDRDMESFINAVNSLGDEYCLVAIGRKADVMKEKTDYLINNNKNFVYLGFFNPPQHLNFLKYAHIGLAPYKPSNVIKNASCLNALYCAPNKIYEYAGYGVPIIGTDVLGLKYPFEKYDIGICCKDLSTTSIKNAIVEIESKYDIMRDNCFKFYNSIDLDDIVVRIIEE